MNTTNKFDTLIAHRALTTMITTANGGTYPTKLDIQVECARDRGPLVYDPAHGHNRLVVTIEVDGRLKVTVGVATSWTMLVHEDFRFALTPGNQFVLLGRHRGRAMFFTFEDDRLLCDAGSPLLSAQADEQAIAAFDDRFATLIGETL